MTPRLSLVLPPSLGAAKAAARADHLGAALSRALGMPVDASVTERYEDLESKALRAEVDIVWCPAAVCAKLTEAQGVYAMVRNGHATYRSALVARKSDRLTTPTLSKVRAAWVDPLSAGGYLLVVALLESRGIDFARAFATQSFVGTHRAVVEAILHGDADVGAVSAHDPSDQGMKEVLRWYAGPPADQLEAIAVTESCPADAIVLTSRLTRGLARTIRDLLVQDSPNRVRVLAALEADGLSPRELSEYRDALLPTLRRLANRP